MSATILIIDDEKPIRDAIRMILKYEGFQIEEAERGDRGLARLAGKGIDAVLLDVKMPGMDGLDVLSEVSKLPAPPPVVMISGHGTVETAVEATRRGAYDFLEKPLDRDRLLLTLRNALSHRTLADQNSALREAIDDRFRIRGESPAIVALRETIERVARSDVGRILVLGENGTGKELVARNLHRLSSRRDGPWVDVNCAAIPKELIESELFGHEKGSFTGASDRKIGRFEQADGGTIFLDEIGDMELLAQAKVLRVLEENDVQRVGGHETIPIDVRVVAATNKDLDQEVAAGRFREDLYYRLNVIPIRVPPLRERGQDIVLLFRHFFDIACQHYGQKPRPLTRDEEVRLLEHDWPGNIRQLKNYAERVALLGPGVPPSNRPATGAVSAPGGPSPEASVFSLANFEEFKQGAESLYLRLKLEENGWNVKRTAENLGMQRSNLYKKIDRYGLAKPLS